MENWIRLIAENAPSSRSSATAWVYGDSILFLGGFDDSQEYFSCDQLDLLHLTWEMNFPLTDELSGHASCLLHSNLILVFGGWDRNEYTNDVKLIDLDQRRINKAVLQEMEMETGKQDDRIPLGRNGHTMTYVENQGVFIFGGWDCTRFSNADQSFSIMWKLTPKWKFESCDIYINSPCARRGHTTTLLNNGDLLIFGGIYGLGRFLNDLYQLTVKDTGFDSLLQEPSGDIPTPRAYHSSSLVSNKMYVYGGICQGNTYSDELYSLSIEDMNWTRLMLENSPGPRAAHCAVIVSKSIVILGGKNDEGHCSLNDVYVLITNEKKNIIRYREDLQDVQDMLLEMMRHNIQVPPIPPDRVNARFFIKKENYFEMDQFPKLYNN